MSVKFERPKWVFDFAVDYFTEGFPENVREIFPCGFFFLSDEPSLDSNWVIEEHCDFGTGYGHINLG